MRRAQDRARSARSRKIGARSTTIKSRALGALKLASEASCARSARWECAREAGRFFHILFYDRKSAFLLTGVSFYNYYYFKRFLFNLEHKSFSAVWFSFNHVNIFKSPCNYLLIIAIVNIISKNVRNP